MAFPSLARWTAGLRGPATDAWLIHNDAMARVAGGDDVIVLSVGDPDFDTPARIRQAAKDSLDAGHTHYADVMGKPLLRAAIARRHGELTGTSVGPDRVVTLAGAQCALFAACQCLLDPGDEIIVPAPAYVTYPATIAASAAVMVSVPMRAEAGFRPDIAAIAAAITPRTRALLINTPANPTGTIYTRAEIEALCALALRHDLWLITDEVYAELVHEGEHVSPAAVDGMADHVIVVNSLSKSHAMTGWRVGWVVGPARVIDAVHDLALAMLYGLPDFIQDAAIVALDHDHAELVEHRRTYRMRRDRLCRALDGIDGLIALPPAGGMFVMLDVRGTGLTADQFARRLLDEQGVSVLSGDAFGGPAAGHVRISLTLEEAGLVRAAARIRQFVHGIGSI